MTTRRIIGMMLLGMAAAAVQAVAANNCTVNAGPIWNQQDANQKCPQVCGAGYGPWTGQWWTTVPGQMSVCQCGANNKSFDAGPIWNQPDANKKCPATCTKNQGTWTGQWWTTEPGKMSVCQCAVCAPETAPAKP